MRCMNEETFGPTLPVMRVGDAKEAVRLANDGPYGLQASVWTRDTEQRERLARRIEAGVACVNDAQLNYARPRAADGRLEGIGPGLSARPGRHPQVHEAPVAPDHPGLRAVARAPHVPVLGRGHRAVGEAISAARDQRAVHGRAAPHPARLLRHADPVAATPPEGADGVGDPTASGRAPPRTSGCPRRSRSRSSRSGAPEEQLAGLRRLLDALAERGWSPRLRRRPARQLVHALSDSSPEALAGIHTLRGLTLSIFYALPDLGTGRNPSWDAIGYPGPQRQPPAEPKPLAVRRPEPGPTR